MLRRTAAELREVLPGDGPGAADIAQLIADVPDDDLRGGRPQPRRPRPRTRCATRSPQIDDTRPTVILAYTLKGYGLAIEGHPQNHSALLTEAQFDELADAAGRRSAPTRGPPFPADSARRPACSPRGRSGCGAHAARPLPAPAVPADLGRTPTGDGDHPGRARPDAARPQPGRSRGRPPGS